MRTPSPQPCYNRRTSSLFSYRCNAAPMLNIHRLTCCKLATSPLGEAKAGLFVAWENETVKEPRHMVTRAHQSVTKEWRSWGSLGSRPVLSHRMCHCTGTAAAPHTAASLAKGRAGVSAACREATQRLPPRAKCSRCLPLLSRSLIELSWTPYPAWTRQDALVSMRTADCPGALAALWQ